MTLHRVSPTEKITPNIDFSNPDSISSCVRQHFHEAPEGWMKACGFYTGKNSETLQAERIIDFDLKVKGLDARLLGVELRGISDSPEVFSMNGTNGDSSALDERTIQLCVQAVIDLVRTGSCKGIILAKDTPDIDYTGIQTSLESIAKCVVYGGNIITTFHDTTSSATIQNPASQAEGEYVIIKANWGFQWPTSERQPGNNISDDLQPRRRQQTWRGRLQAAMVDGEQGWIGKDDPIPGGVQFTRALRKHGLVYDRVEESVHYENGVRVGASGRFSFHWWGRDE